MMASSLWISFCLQVLLRSVTIWQQHGVQAIKAVSSPVSTAGVVGQEAEFSCSVADKLPTEILKWQLQWDATDSGLNQYAHVDGEQNATHTFEDLPEKHAAYTTRYSVNGSIHTTILHITNIQPSDEGAVSCVYQISSAGGSLITRMIPEYTAVRFTVWKLPSPSCSFNLDPNYTTFNITVGSTVEFTCADSVGIPTPNLTWYSGAKTQGQSKSLEGHNAYRYTLQPEDNGGWFTCEGISTASTEPVMCRVRPMMVPPTAEVNPKLIQLIEGAGNIKFTCTGSGLPEIISYQWYIDDWPAVPGDHEIYSYIAINQNEPNGSVIFIQSVPTIGKTIIHCEVSVSPDLKARANGTVIVFEREKTTMSAVVKQSKLNFQRFRLNASLSVIVIPTCVIVFIIIIFVVLFVWHRKYRHVFHENDNDTHTFAYGEANGGVPKRRFWGYMVTSV